MNIHPKVTIGHVHLTISDLDRSLAFYQKLLGFEVTARYKDSAVFLSAGGYHHHIALNTWAGKGAPQPPVGRTGLYHFAILYPTQKELARTLKRLLDAGYPIEGSADHGVSEAIYLKDPDGIGVELYADRPKKEWRVSVNGEVEMNTLPFNLSSFLEKHAPNK